jgi:hypothetical protein
MAMKFERNRLMIEVALVFCLVGGCAAQMAPELKAKVDAKARELNSWSTDTEMVSAVKAYNNEQPQASREMNNEKWKSLTILDPFVRSFSNNSLGQYLKGKKSPAVAEIFVSGADGGKVAFLSKTTSWSHKGKPKHDVPMTGKTWIGPIEMDESTGQQQVQVAVPVMDAGKPIGSIVVGLKTAAL